MAEDKSGDSGKSSGGGGTGREENSTSTVAGEGKNSGEGNDEGDKGKQGDRGKGSGGGGTGREENTTSTGAGEGKNSCEGNDEGDKGKQQDKESNKGNQQHGYHRQFEGQTHQNEDHENNGQKTHSAHDSNSVAAQNINLEKNLEDNKNRKETVHLQSDKRNSETSPVDMKRLTVTTYHRKEIIAKDEETAHLQSDKRNSETSPADMKHPILENRMTDQNPALFSNSDKQTGFLSNQNPIEAQYDRERDVTKEDASESNIRYKHEFRDDNDETSDSNTDESLEDYTSDDDQTALSKFKKSVEKQESCAFHENMGATYFCTDVSKPVCAECFMENTHWKVEYYPKYVSKISKQLLKEKEKIIHVENETKQFIKELNDMKAEEERQENARSDEISEHVSRMCKIIYETGNNLKKENKSRKRENIRLLDDCIKSLTDTKKQLSSAKKSVGGMSKNGRILEMKALLRNIKREIESRSAFNQEFQYPELDAYRFTTESFVETELTQLVGELDSNEYYESDKSDSPRTEPAVENLTDNMQEIINNAVSLQLDQILRREDGYFLIQSLLDNESGHLRLQEALKSTAGNVFLKRFFLSDYGERMLVDLIKTDAPHVFEKLSNIPEIQAFITTNENLSRTLIISLFNSKVGKHLIGQILQTDEGLKIIDNVLNTLTPEKGKILMENYLRGNTGNNILSGWFQTNIGMKAVCKFLSTTKSEYIFRAIFKTENGQRNLLGFLKDTSGQILLTEYLASENGYTYFCDALQTTQVGKIVLKVLEYPRCRLLKDALKTSTGHEVVKQFLTTDVGKAMAKSRVDADRPFYMKGIEALDIKSLPWKITSSVENGKLAIELNLDMKNDSELEWVIVKFDMVLENTKNNTEESIRLNNVVYKFFPGSSYKWNNIIPLADYDHPKNGFIDREGVGKISTNFELLEYSCHLRQTVSPVFSTMQSLMVVQDLPTRQFRKPVSRKACR